MLARRLQSLSVLGCLLAVPAAGQSSPGATEGTVDTGQRTASSAARKGGRWSVQVELEGGWDDNICELSDTDRDDVGDPRFADRFKIESPDDWFVEPSVRVGYARRSAGQRRTAIRFDARVTRYLQNSVKNYEAYGVRFAQDLTGDSRHGTRLVLRGGHTPDFYLRELTVPQATLEQGRRVRDSSRYEETSLSAAVEQVLVPERLELEGRLETERRDYFAPFDERDGDLTGYRVRLEWYPATDRRFSIGAGFRQQSYDAEGDRAATPAFEPDISSDRTELALGLGLRWSFHGRRGDALLELSREERDFTSGNPVDRFHFGRDDTLSEYRLSIGQQVRQDLHLRAELRREENDSNLGRAPSALSDDVTDYTRNVVSMSIGWRF